MNVELDGITLKKETSYNLREIYIILGIKTVNKERKSIVKC